MGDRRSFLGSLVGLVVSHPFFSRLAVEPEQQLPIVCVPGYKMLMRDSLTGYTIQAPGIQEIVRTPGCIEFRAHTLTAEKQIRLDQAILLDNHGIVLHTFNYLHHGVHLYPGDSLVLTPQLLFNPNLNFENPKQLFTARNRHLYWAQGNGVLTPRRA